MTVWLRQNTSVALAFGPFISIADGSAAVAGITFVSGDIRVKKNNANWLSTTGASDCANEDGNRPFYEIGLSAGVVDTLGVLKVAIYPTSAAVRPFQVWQDFMVVPPALYDAHFGAVAGIVPANVRAWQDVTVQAITTANLAIPADVVVWAHSSVSAMPGPAAGATGNVNVVAWQGVTVQAITTANNAIPADIVVWAHSTVSAMPGAAAAATGNVNVLAWAGVTVPAITTVRPYPMVDMVVASHVTLVPAPVSATPYIPSDVLLWEHATAAALSSGLVQTLIADISAGAIETAGFAPGTTIPAVTSVLSNVGANVLAIAAGAITQTAIAGTVLVSANVGQWNLSAVSAMPGTPFNGRVNVVAWQGVTVQAITTANLAIPSDVVVWGHSTVSAMPGASTPAFNGRVDVISWQGTTVQAITTANNAIPVDVIVWAHSTVSSMPSHDANVLSFTAGALTQAAIADTVLVSANVGQWNLSPVTAMPGPAAGATGNVNVVAWQGVTVQAITTANLALPVDVVLWAHSTVSAMPGPAAGATGNVNVVAWQGVTVQAITTANNAIPADVVVWAHSTVSAMPGPAAGATGNVNVVAWAGVTVPAITSAAPYVQADVRAMANDIITAAVIANGAIDQTAIASTVLISANVGQWNASQVSAMPGAPIGAVPNVNVLAWAGVTVPAITTIRPYPAVDMVVASHVTLIPTPTSATPYLPTDLLLWEHATANALITGRVDSNTQALANNVITQAAIAGTVLVSANVGQWNAAAVSAMPGASTPAFNGRVNVVAWQGVTVQAITTTNNALPVDVVVWGHASVSAMPGASTPAFNGRVNVIAWQDVTVQAITTANLALPVDVVLWAHSTVSAMPGASTIVGSVNVNMWAGTSVAAITTAGTIPVDQIYQNHTSVGTPGTGSDVNVVTWGGEAVANVLLSANVGQWNASPVTAMPGSGILGAGSITASTFAAGAIDAAALAADAVDAILDDPLEGATTLRQAIRIMLASLAGKLAGAATATITIRDINDTVDRITATVDENGNRIDVTVNGA